MSLVSGISPCCSAIPHAFATVKFFTSIKWQGKFADLAAQFMVHKGNLQSDLQLHISITVTHISDTLASFDEKITMMTAMMAMVFGEMQSPEEKEWAAFARRNGGVERVLKNDELLKEVFEEQKVETKDEKGSAGKGGQMPMPPMALAEFEKELAKDVETVLAENTKAFDQKFGAIELSLREVNVTIQRHSDRVVGALAGIHAGPHDRIVDKVLDFVCS